MTTLPNLDGSPFLARDLADVEASNAILESARTGQAVECVIRPSRVLTMMLVMGVRNWDYQPGTVTGSLFGRPVVISTK